MFCDSHFRSPGIEMAPGDTTAGSRPSSRIAARTRAVPISSERATSGAGRSHFRFSAARCRHRWQQNFGTRPCGFTANREWHSGHVTDAGRFLWVRIGTCISSRRITRRNVPLPRQRRPASGRRRTLLVGTRNTSVEARCSAFSARCWSRAKGRGGLNLSND